MNNARNYVMWGLILSGIMSRLIPHPPNFTALTAIALFSGVNLASRSTSLGIVFVVLALTDLIYGFHSTMPFVYLSFGLTALIGHFISKSKSWLSLPLASALSALIFFLVSNFGVWLTSSMYSKTVEGLQLCYLAALPFLRNQMVGDFLFTLAIFGAFRASEQILSLKRSYR